MENRRYGTTVKKKENRQRTAKSTRSNNIIIDDGLQKELDLVDLELENRNRKNGRQAKDVMEKYAHNEIIDSNLRFSIGSGSVGSKDGSLSP